MSTQCPKCHAFSGDDWRQCGGTCPMPMSPHYRPSAATTPEPEPVRSDSPAVWPLVIRSLLEGEVDEPRARVVERLAADMGARDAEGRRKYGVPLQVENGRDAACDAYQEALDLTVYARQQWERHHTRVWWLIYQDALWLASRICAELMEAGR